MSEHLPTGAEAHSKFDHAKRQAVVEGMVALVRGKPSDLLPFDDVQRKLGLHITRERGLQQVPLDQIVGSAGKYHDFTRSFWPRNEKLRERWKWIYVAAHDFRGLPPVELYQVGEVYFVKDGKEELLMQSVDLVEPEEDGVFRLVGIFGDQKIVRGRIKRMNLVNHKILFEE
jgi:predicted RNA-binding protein